MNAPSYTVEYEPANTYEGFLFPCWVATIRFPDRNEELVKRFSISSRTQHRAAMAHVEATTWCMDQIAQWQERPNNEKAADIPTLGFADC